MIMVRDQYLCENFLPVSVFRARARRMTSRNGGLLLRILKQSIITLGSYGRVDLYEVGRFPRMDGEEELVRGHVGEATFSS